MMRNAAIAALGLWVVAAAPGHVHGQATPSPSPSAGITISGQSTSHAAPPGDAQAPGAAGAVLPGASATARATLTPRPRPTPLPDSGSAGNFSYQRSPEHPGFFDISFSDGSPGVLVSEDVVQSAMSGPNANSPMSVTLLKGYPKIAERTYEILMGDFFPAADDKAGAARAPFASRVLGDPSGVNATIEIDPLAPNFVRVSMRGEDGQVAEFSVSRSVAEKMLARTDLDDAKKIALLQKAPMTLPESVRPDYRNLTKEQLWAAVADDPKVAKQAVVQFHKIQLQERAADAAESTGTVTTTATQPVATPAVRPAPRRTASTTSPTRSGDSLITTSAKEGAKTEHAASSRADSAGAKMQLGRIMAAALLLIVLGTVAFMLLARRMR